MERETKLQDIMNGIVAEMKRMRYCRASLDDFLLNCRRYAAFAASEGKDGMFSEKLGIRFLAPLYDNCSTPVNDLINL